MRPKSPGDEIARFEKLAVAGEKWLAEKTAGIQLQNKRKDDEQVYPYLTQGHRIILLAKRAELRGAAYVLGISGARLEELAPLLTAQEIRIT